MLDSLAMENGPKTPLAPVRAVVGVLAVVAALTASAELYQASSEARTQSPDAFGVAGAAERFEAARRVLPQHGTVAYLTDLPERTGGVPYLAASFALAPLLVVHAEKNPGAAWAVGNFSHPLDYAAAGAPYGYIMISDSGNGVVLYRKAAR